MKNILDLRLLLFTFAVVSLVFLSGCSNDDDNSTSPNNLNSSREREFTGTWLLTKITVTDLSGTQEVTPDEAGMSMTIIVNADKTFQNSITIGGQTETETGNWEINGDFIVLTLNGNSQMLPYTVENNKFTIENFIQQDDILISQLLEFTKQ